MYNKSILYNSFDWLQGTVYCDSALEVFKLLEDVDSRLSIDNFILSNSGLLGYSTRYMFHGKGSIQVCWNPTFKEDILNSHYIDNRSFLCRQLGEKSVNDNESFPGVFISVSGDGLRFLGCNQFKLFEGLFALDFKPTRLDVAIDFFDPDNSYIPFLQSAFHNEFYNRLNKERDSAIMQTKMNRESLKPFPNVYPAFLDKERKTIVNWTFGGNKSHKGKVRLYDKWLEVNTVPRLKGVSDELLADVPDNYWWRLEYVVKDKYADSLFKTFMSLYLTKRKCNMACVVLWCLENFFQFRIFKSEGYNVCQCDICQVWINLKAYFEALTEEELNFNLAKLPYVPSARFFAHTKRESAFITALLFYLNQNPSYIHEIIKVGWKKFDSSPHYIELRNELVSSNSSIFDSVTDFKVEFKYKDYFTKVLGYSEEEFDKLTIPFN